MKRFSRIALFAATCAATAQDRTVKLPGEFLPYQSVDIVARVAGFVESIPVDRGSVVKKGDVLAKLSAPEMAAQRAEAAAKVEAVKSQRAEAEARLVAAQSTSERLQAASSTPGAVAGNEVILAGKSVDAAKALIASLHSSLKAAEASVQAIDELTGFLTVTAPFDGIVTERLEHPGALAGPQKSPLMRLEQLNRLRLVVAVPEVELGAVRTGRKVMFTVPAFSGRKFSGTVSRVARVMDVKTRTMPVEIDVQNPGGELAPGMYPEVVWLEGKPAEKK